jgi:septum formation protein
MKGELILASASPRRHELMLNLGMPFTIRVANVDEESVTDPDPATNVCRTAALKARAVAADLAAEADHPAPDSILVAADTTVAVDGRRLAKPSGADEAWWMLRLLRGRRHQVYTGISLLQPASGRIVEAVAATIVTMRDYSDAEIAAYIATGDPMDKAGAYAIQHPHFRPVAALDGCYANVVGLPLCHLVCALEGMGITLPLPGPVACPPHPRQCPFYPTSLEKWADSC